MPAAMPRLMIGLTTFATLVAASNLRAQDDDRLALYVADLDARKISLVTDEPLKGHAYCGSPDWSPDGKRILLDATPGRQWNQTHMLVADFPLPEPKQFTDLGPGNCPAWSPDGKQVVFLLNSGSVPDADSGVYLMDAHGKNRRRLGGYGMPEWSPDGKSILTISFSNPANLTLIDVATGKEQAISLADHTIHSVPGWAGDGQTLVAVIRGQGPLMIALLDITDPPAAKVKEVLWTRGQTTDPEPMHPVYATGTGRVAFAGRTPQKGSALYVLDAKRNLTPQPVEPGRFDPRIASLEIAPDGKRLLFCAERALSEEAKIERAVAPVKPR